MGSALLNDLSDLSAVSALSTPAQHGAELRLPPADAASALRRQAAERIALHRSRRTPPDAATGAAPTPARNARAAKIASLVAQRYAQTQSYRDFLAAEADRALEQAHAAAEVAARNTQALADAQQNLLDQILDEGVAAIEPTPPSDPHPGRASHPQHDHAPLLWQEPEAHLPGAPHSSESRRFHPPQPRTRRPRRNPAPPTLIAEPASSIPPDIAQSLADGITIRLYQDETGATRVSLGPPPAANTAARPSHLHAAQQSEEEAILLDEEIAFRHEPVFEESSTAAEPLPANLIEFPRQLVATRKARPRRAEGPLLEEVPAAPGAGQLRIFEVDSAEIALTPPDAAPDESADPAQWTSIWLDARPGADTLSPRAVTGEAAAAASPSTHSFASIASVSRRLLAAAINTAILTAACAAFAVVFLWTAAHASGSAAQQHLAHTLAGKGAVLSALPFAACAYALFAAIYQALFFTLSTATPGMLAARIALCTFADENPTRRALRRRLPVLLLSAVSLGLGFLWAALDEQRLAWHDRICGIYQRSY